MTPFLSHRQQIQALPKVVVLLGPTASGKTGWGLKLAKHFSGEIVSADSRQIYKKMDIGTAKPQGEWRRNGLRRTFYVDDVPHHLIDFLDPGKVFTVAEFRDKSIKYIKMAHKDGHVPFVVGGTGLYITALIDNFTIPRVPANKKLRLSLEDKSLGELFDLLEKLDPQAAKTIDRQNKRRMIRALEVCIFTGEPFSAQQERGEPLFDILQIGIDVPRAELDKRIEERVDRMMAAGLEKEVRALMRQRYSWELSSMNGIGYKQFKPYLEEQVSLSGVVDAIKKDTKKFARRQLTWFRRDKRIQWCTSYEEAFALVEGFLKG